MPASTKGAKASASVQKARSARRVTLRATCARATVSLPPGSTNSLSGGSAAFMAFVQSCKAAVCASQTGAASPMATAPPTSNSRDWIVTKRCRCGPSPSRDASRPMQLFASSKAPTSSKRGCPLGMRRPSANAVSPPSPVRVMTRLMRGLGVCMEPLGWSLRPYGQARRPAWGLAAASPPAKPARIRECRWPRRRGRSTRSPRHPPFARSSRRSPSETASSTN